MRGKFITFEGCEGVGKSTQIQLLKQYLNDTQQEVVFLREPGGTNISEKIREIILSVDSVGMSSKCEAILYSAARAQLVDEVVRPSLERGQLVACDRFVDSSYAYQGQARGLGFEYVSQLISVACGDVAPDLTIFFDLSPKLGFERKGGADKGDRLEVEKLEFHQKVYEGYKIVCEKFSDRVCVVDASSDMQSVHNQVLQILRQREIIK
ncbi:MAG: dTMP kinase [Clostridia bacterium]